MNHGFSDVAWPFRAGSRLFALIFPTDCAICDAPLHHYTRVPVCGACLNAPEIFLPDYFCAQCRTPFLHEAPLDERGLCRMCRLGATAYDAAYAWGSYEGTLREIIHCFKFRSMRPLAAHLARYLSDALPLDERLDAIVPMPLHWRRRMERGFNQCEAMAALLSKRTGLPVWKAVTRIRNTPSQAQLTSAKRRKNVFDAFRLKDQRQLAGKRLLLLDDVLTTGATANACAAALKRGGAARVVVLTVARVDRRSLRESDAGLNMISVGQENARR